MDNISELSFKDKLISYLDLKDKKDSARAQAEEVNSRIVTDALDRVRNTLAGLEVPADTYTINLKDKGNSLEIVANYSTREYYMAPWSINVNSLQGDIAWSTRTNFNSFRDFSNICRYARTLSFLTENFTDILFMLQDAIQFESTFTGQNYDTLEDLKELTASIKDLPEADVKVGGVYASAIPTQEITVGTKRPYKVQRPVYKLPKLRGRWNKAPDVRAFKVESMNAKTVTISFPDDDDYLSSLGFSTSHSSLLPTGYFPLLRWKNEKSIRGDEIIDSVAVFNKLAPSMVSGKATRRLSKNRFMKLIRPKNLNDVYLAGIILEDRSSLSADTLKDLIANL